MTTNPVILVFGSSDFSRSDNGLLVTLANEEITLCPRH